MQIRKTYREVNPELLFNEIKDFTLKQGVTLGEAKMDTYSTSDSSSFISRGTLTFTVLSEGKQKECLRAHIVGQSKAETKLMLDIDEKLFASDKSSALLGDLDFVFSTYEVK